MGCNKHQQAIKVEDNTTACKRERAKNERTSGGHTSEMEIEDRRMRFVEGVDTLSLRPMERARSWQGRGHRGAQPTSRWCTHDNESRETATEHRGLVQSVHVWIHRFFQSCHRVRNRVVINGRHRRRARWRAVQRVQVERAGSRGRHGRRGRWWIAPIVHVVL
jgi:hypothetical protein